MFRTQRKNGFESLFHFGLILLMFLLLLAIVQAEDYKQTDGEVELPVLESTNVIQEFSEERTSASDETDGGEVTLGEETTEDEIEPEEFEEEEEIAISDPLQPWNRLMYHFNDRLYFWLLKPVARGYNAVVPEGARVSVRNFFNNLTMPVRFVNALFQGKVKSAANELARFSINSTIGVAGLFDVAKKKFNLKSQEEDLGQTMGYYGLGEGLYIIWPFIGPSSLRDTIGMVGDGFLTPVNYIDGAEVVLAIHSYDHVNNTSLEIGEYEDMKESAIEPYVAIRNAYFQYRRSKIKK
jgi:phospholipid-binding lipoprotein MlaA